MARTLALAVVMLTPLVHCLAEEAPVPPEVTAVAARQPVRIDGRLDEPCWRRAQPMTDFHVLGEEGETAGNTTARVAYDDTWLYVGVNCAQPAIESVEPTHLSHDDAVHSDESIEIFIDPGANGTPYFHFKLNCANVKAEQRAFATSARETTWDTPWLSATRLHPEGWDAEVAIPLYELASHGELSRATINVTRNAVIPDIDRQGATLGWKRQLSTWAPLLRSFHEPDLFGALKGLDVERLAVPFLASFNDATIGPYRMVGDEYRYGVTLQVRGHNHRPGRVEVAVIDEPASGKGRTVTRTVEVEGTVAQTVELSVPVALPVERTTTVVMTDAATGAELRRTRITDTSALELMSAYLDRTYYTTEDEAIVVCSLGMRDGALRDTILTATDRDGAVLARQADPGGEARIAIPIRNLPAGSHTISLQWQRAGGDLIFSQDLTLVKLPPRPGLEWKIDRLNGVILRDGQPFFPFGLLMAGISSEDEEDIRRVAEAGFNSIAHWTFAGDPAEVGAYLDVADSHGLAVLARLEACNKRGVDREILAEFFEGEALDRVAQAASHCGATHLKGLLVSNSDLRSLSREARSRIFAQYYQSTLDPILESVRIAREHENCIGFNHFDEPTLSIFDQHVQGRDLYRRVHEIDGYHPVFLLYSSYIPEGEHAVDWCDALGTDPYWVPAGQPTRNTPNFVSKITHWTRQRADSMQKATWIVPMAEFWSGVHKRAILPREQHCQTYLALIHGARALWYFRYPILHQGTWDALSEVAKQLQVLGPIAVTPDIPQQITYDPGQFDPENEEYPDVQVSLRANPAGGQVLLAANSRPWPLDVTFTLSCLGAEGTVGRLFAEDRHQVRDGSFTDRMEPYATRAYAIAEPAATAEPARIRVTMTAHQEAAGEPEREIPRSGRTGRRNLLPNPSFEDATLPGWPDYYRPWYSEPLIGSPDAGWGQDDTDPWHGQYCLRITKNTPRYNGTYFYIAPQHNRPVRYVFSLYLRAERDGMQVTVGGGGFDWKKLTLTTSWERYHVTGIVPPRADRHTMLQVRLLDDGRIWADALQFEAGEEPTDFEA
ncbi:MAG: sugar-binding protein [Armatimonadota bacterium]|nr:sugar-binding protein [Armatimonadota bacterium]